MKIAKPIRQFIESDLKIESWKSIELYITDLLNRELNSKNDFYKWLKDKSELDAFIEEDAAWRYIKMTINTKDEKLSDAYSYYVTEIQPKLAPFEDKLNRKLNDSVYLKELESDPAFFIHFRSIKKALELYRKENIQLISEISEESKKFGSLSAAQTIIHEGEVLTMQRAVVLLKETSEEIRKAAFTKISNRRRDDFSAFNKLFNVLLKKRHKIAVNAGFKNFRDYKMEALGRFDYSIEDCFNFHESVKNVIVPLIKYIQQNRLDKLGKTKFKPWDLDVDPEGKEPLKPFKGVDELLNGTVDILSDIDPYFGDCIATMSSMNHLDLESKEGKSPGGYNYPLYEIGVPFIFMNAVGTHRDLVTMVHEGGHAVHSFLSRNLSLIGFKSTPSEVAELASMAMELLSMDHWDVFYADAADLKRAKLEQLEKVLETLPWVASIDKFQHWIYTNKHTAQQRKEKWLEISSELGNQIIDWEGNENVHANLWQKQLHLYEVPFYYIEYGIAQLGAIAMWRSYKQLGKQGLDNYIDALKLGYTKTIGEIYETAGIKFDFSTSYVKELVNFIKKELEELS